MKIAPSQGRWPARGALFPSRFTFLAGGEENERLLLSRFLRLLSFLIFFDAKTKVLLCLVFPGIKAARRRILNFKWLIFEKWTVGCIVVSDILRVYGVLSTNSRQNSSEDTPDSNSYKTTKTTIQVRITQLPKTNSKQEKTAADLTYVKNVSWATCWTGGWAW